MPKDVFDAQYQYLAQSSLLSFEEITRLAQRFVLDGVQKIRLTGGEPLLRKNLEVLIEQLAALRTPHGQPIDLTLTTNGALLARKARALKSAGLQRVTVSLDSLDDAVFRRMNDVDFPVAEVLNGISEAQAAGLGPIKVNMVVQRGVNEHQILPMARHFKGSGIVLRFIEYMDVGNSNGWRMDDVLPSAQVVGILRSEFPLIALEATAPGETAQRWGYANQAGLHDSVAGELGVISSVTRAFCQDCTRARLSTDGKVYLCLFAGSGHDLRELLRSGATDEELTQAIRQIWSNRMDRYSQLRGTNTDQDNSGLSTALSKGPRVEMSHIGG